MSGVYELICPDCGKVYVGKLVEVSEPDLMNTNAPLYTLHLTEHSHTLRNMQDVMRVLQFQKKGIHLDTIERFHIHRQAAINNHLNDDHTLSVNRIFDSILGDFQNELK